MLKNFLYLNQDALAEYLSSLEGGLRSSSEHREASELVKRGETSSHADLMSALGVGSFIQATVGSFGAMGGW
jgi:hypothetical protein